MKKLAFVLAFALCALPLFGQKLTKEEKTAQAQARYEAALEALNEKAWVLVPSEYTTPDAFTESNQNNSYFLSYERDQVFGRGAFIVDNNENNVGEVTRYDVKVDKKGNIKVIMAVMGRMWKGTYKINIRKGDNHAEVTFTPSGNNKSYLRFEGPIVPLAGADYQKIANPI